MCLSLLCDDDDSMQGEGSQVPSEDHNAQEAPQNQSWWSNIVHRVLSQQPAPKVESEAQDFGHTFKAAKSVLDKAPPVSVAGTTPFKVEEWHGTAWRDFLKSGNLMNSALPHCNPPPDGFRAPPNSPTSPTMPSKGKKQAAKNGTTSPKRHRSEKGHVPPSRPDSKDNEDVHGLRDFHKNDKDAAKDGSGAGNMPMLTSEFPKQGYARPTAASRSRQVGTQAGLRKEVRGIARYGEQADFEKYVSTTILGSGRSTKTTDTEEQVQDDCEKDVNSHARPAEPSKKPDNLHTEDNLSGSIFDSPEAIERRNELRKKADRLIDQARAMTNAGKHKPDGEKDSNNDAEPAGRSKEPDNLRTEDKVLGPVLTSQELFEVGRKMRLSFDKHMLSSSLKREEDPKGLTEANKLADKPLNFDFGVPKENGKLNKIKKTFFGGSADPFPEKKESPGLFGKSVIEKPATGLFGQQYPTASGPAFPSAATAGVTDKPVASIFDWKPSNDTGTANLFGHHGIFAQQYPTASGPAFPSAAAAGESASLFGKPVAEKPTTGLFGQQHPAASGPAFPSAATASESASLFGKPALEKPKTSLPGQPFANASRPRRFPYTTTTTAAIEKEVASIFDGKFSKDTGNSSVFDNSAPGISPRSKTPDGPLLSHILSPPASTHATDHPLFGKGGMPRNSQIIQVRGHDYGYPPTVEVSDEELRYKLGGLIQKDSEDDAEIEKLVGGELLPTDWTNDFLTLQETLDDKDADFKAAGANVSAEPLDREEYMKHLDYYQMLLHNMKCLSRSIKLLESMKTTILNRAHEIKSAEIREDADRLKSLQDHDITIYRRACADTRRMQMKIIRTLLDEKVSGKIKSALVAGYESKIEALRNLVKELTLTNTTLQSSLKTLEENQAAEKPTDWENLMEVHKTLIEDQKRDIDIYLELAKAAEEAEKAMKSDNDRLTKLHQEHTHDIQELRKENTRLNASLVQVKQNLASEEAVKELKDKSNELSKLKKESSETIDALKKKVKDLKEEIKQNLIKIGNKEAKMAKEQKKMKKVQNRHEQDVTEELRQQLREFDETRQSLVDETQKREEAEMKAAEAEEKRIEAEKKAEEKEKQLTVLKITLREAQQALQEAVQQPQLSPAPVMPNDPVPSEATQHQGPQHEDLRKNPEPKRGEEERLGYTVKYTKAKRTGDPGPKKKEEPKSVKGPKPVDFPVRTAPAPEEPQESYPALPGQKASTSHKAGIWVDNKEQSGDRESEQPQEDSYSTVAGKGKKGPFKFVRF